MHFFEQFDREHWSTNNSRFPETNFFSLPNILETSNKKKMGDSKETDKEIEPKKMEQLCKMESCRSGKKVGYFSGFH